MSGVRNPHRPQDFLLMSGDQMSLFVQQVDSIYLNHNVLEIAKLLEDSYEGDFSEEDWLHTFGGARFVGTLENQIVAHAAVVPRAVLINDLPRTIDTLKALLFHLGSKVEDLVSIYFNM